MAKAWKSLTALGQDAPQTIDIGPFRIAERFDVALASVAQRHGQEAGFARAAGALGLPLPGPARAAGGPVLAAFWIAPGMWMAEAPFASHEDIVAALKPAFGETASITEQTDAWVRFDLTAPDLGPLLARLCNVDWPQAPDGFASRTVMDHLGCYLIRVTAGQAVLYGPRSSAASLLHGLKVAARSLV